MEELKKMLKQIKAVQNDDEHAHILEDSMRQYALKLISNDHPESVKIAKLALSTSKLEFSRWCA